MTTDVHDARGFTTPLRVLFGFEAIVTILSNAPWTQSSAIVASTAYVGSLMWGLMAAFGYTKGWQRHITMSVAVVYLLLTLCKIAGFPA